jgi:hypothetical protein
MIRVRGGIAHISSSREKSVKYHVHYSPMLKRWLCDCPDFRYRRMDSGENCKHITEYLTCLETASMAELEKILHDN